MLFCLKGKDALVTKHTVTAAGGILAPTDIFVDPNPPHKNGDPEMHCTTVEKVLNGMKFKNTADVTGAEFYQKKVGDQSKQIATLTREKKDAERNFLAVNHANNLVLIELAEKYGVKVTDDEGIACIGYRLQFPVPSVELDRKYDMRVEKKDGVFTVGIVLKEENHAADDDTGETDHEEEPLADPAWEEREAVSGTV
jgi:hypothetical protein